MKGFGVFVLMTMLQFAGVPAAELSDTADRRAADVEARMTDAERFQLLHGIMPIPLPIPGFPAVPPGLPVTAGYLEGVPRLGIPNILETDGPLGVVNPLHLRAGDVATAMPSALALASTFDADLAFQSGAMIGGEARAKGFNVLLGGAVNLARDPRNGRNFEYLGEDPLLAGTLAAEAVRGTQTQGVVCTVKHFALNDQETLRSTLDANIDEAALRESDLLAFEIAIERGRPGAVMCAYNKVNGDYACGNDFLLNRVLKRDWGYHGWVMSDWGAVHEVSYFSKGLDQESASGLDKEVWFDGALQAEIEAGRVAKSRVSDAVRRILRSLYAVGADQPRRDTAIDYVVHAAVARRAAAEGITLLKNDGILPLTANVRKIAVIGGRADLGVLSGGGSSQVTPYGDAPSIVPRGGHGLRIFSLELYMPPSPVKALEEALPDSRIAYDNGYDIESAVARASDAELVIVFATQWQTEGTDHGSMSLPEGQDALINALVKANRKVIVVLETGNPVTMPWLTNVAAVVEAWYPGEQGGAAIADVLTGVVNPSGHLPITFPLDESQTPRPTITGLGLPDRSQVTVDYSEGSNIGYRWFAANHLTPLFPFGFGLSYTSFEFTQLKFNVGKTITASFTVRNSGRRAGIAVPQLYLVSAAGQPLQRLAAFSRVALDPDQRRTVQTTVDQRLLAHWNTAAQRWQIDAGRYAFALGASATDLRERGEISLASHSIKP
jgi:beta-glucosidase